jgi:peptide-methionine (S)-S-oxide reductase
MRRILTVASFFVLLTSGLVMATPKPNVNPDVGRQEMPSTEAIAIFAGGCFWCMEPPFDKTDGVLATLSGYVGGHVENPTYAQVSAGTTGHYEAVKVVYNPSVVSYEQLLDVFWRNIDPVDARGQFCDKGQSYLSAIFALDAEQQRAAAESLKRLEASGKFSDPIATRLLEASQFYPAEDYHQDYYQKNPVRYKFYRSRCGRDDRLEEVWGPTEKAR